VLSTGQRFDFAVFGLCSDRAKLSFWRHDRMPLPLAYLNQEELVAGLKQALEQAEETAKALVGSVRLLSSAGLAPTWQADRKRVQSMVKHLAPDRLYWSRLEIPFREFLVRLADNPDKQERIIAQWVTEELYCHAGTAFELTAGNLDQTARMLRAV